MVQSIYQNEEIGGPAYDGLTFGGYALTTPLVKADYPGLRAIRLEDGTVILAEDLPDSYTIPPAGGGGGGPHTHDWADVTGEPSTFPPSSHDTDHDDRFSQLAHTHAVHADSDHDDRFSLLAHAHAGVYAPVEHDTTHDDRFSLLAHTHAVHADSDHDDRFSLLAHTHAATLGMVKGRAQDLTGGTIQTTAAVKLTAALTIPGTWTGYDIEVVMSGRVVESGTLTGNRTATHEIRLTGTSGTLLGSMLQAIGVDTPDNSLPFSIVGYVTGQTTTGTVNVVYVCSLATDNNQTSWTHATLIATAYQTS